VLGSPFARTVLGSLLLAVPFASVGPISAACIPGWSRSVAAVLASLSAPLASSAVPAPLAPEPEEQPRVSVDNAFEPVVLTAAPRRPAKNKPAPPSTAGALFVSRAKVLALAQSAARPQGSFVPQTIDHPAGLRLTGVGGLGIGVSDGDILIEALGVTPRSAGQIIALVLQARAQKVPVLSGALWRRGQILRITVEQPYLGEQPS
jgi:hypothetical protein